jgi:hypothetical protein
MLYCYHFSIFSCFFSLDKFYNEIIVSNTVVIFLSQTDKVIYFATEAVVPLETYLQNNTESHNETAISWGLHQVLVCAWLFSLLDL